MLYVLYNVIWMLYGLHIIYIYIRLKYHSWIRCHMSCGIQIDWFAGTLMVAAYKSGYPPRMYKTL